MSLRARRALLDSCERRRIDASLGTCDSLEKQDKILILGMTTGLSPRHLLQAHSDLKSDRGNQSGVVGCTDAGFFQRSPKAVTTGELARLVESTDVVYGVAPLLSVAS